VKEGAASLGDLAFCNSPFDDNTPYWLLKSLVRILNALPIRVHFLNSVWELEKVRPRTALLHQSSLVNANADHVNLVTGYVEQGMNVAILSDHFYRGTTAAANRILSRFDLQMKDDNPAELSIDSDGLARQIHKWPANLDRTDIISDASTVYPHRLTEGVRRVLWSQPCSVLCTGRLSAPLIRTPNTPDEYFAAMSSSNGCVIAVGNSLWSSLSSVGWPYDNDRLLANIFAADNAELHI
jgi:hypothetical protein